MSEQSYLCKFMQISSPLGFGKAPPVLKPRGGMPPRNKKSFTSTVNKEIKLNKLIIFEVKNTTNEIIS